MHKATFTGLAAAVALTTAVGMAAPALAHGHGNSKAHGDCTAGSTWKLQAGANRGGEGHTVEFKFRISSDVANEVWDWQILDNGIVGATGQDTTDSNGDFQEDGSVPNQKGPDTITLQATNSVTGETCTGEVTVKGSH